MSTLLYSLGRWAFGARTLVLAGWLLVLAGVGGGALLLNQGLDNTVSIPGTESQQALDRLEVTFPEVSGSSAQILVTTPRGDDVRDAAIRDEVDTAVERLRDVADVSQAASPFDPRAGGQVSDDGSAAIVTVQLDGQPTTIPDSSKNAIAEISGDLGDRLPDGAQSSYGGQLFSQKIPSPSLVEATGLLVAVLVLMFTLGSFVAAGMPLVNALIGVGISSAAILLATAWTTVTSTAPLLSLMLGLAVGIDYALFVVSRYQQELTEGHPHREAAARSVGTAGSAVIFAGLTVVIALLGLGIVGIPFLTTMGIAASVGVAIAVLISLTLLPALLGFAGDRVRPRAARTRRRERARRASVEGGGGRGAGEERRFAEVFFTRWVRAATRFPVLTVLAVTGVLAVVALPALGLRLALPDAGALPRDEPARVTYERISDRFGPGYNGPLLLTGSIVTSEDPLTLMGDLKAEIERFDGVAAVPLATPNRTADTGIIQVIPEGSPDSQQTKDLVERLRAEQDSFAEKYGVRLSVTGFTAIGIDVSDKLGAALLPFGIVIVGLSLILLTMVFRSIAVPLKATLGYLLSIGVSLGVVTLVFQDGHLAELLNVPRTGPVISFMPIVLMGVLFGLAMDYEVFLVSRMREFYVHTRDARHSIEAGFVSSAKVVTAAALIMFAVFVAFVPEGDSNIKPIALGLAVGVFVDAFVVRMTLVPAVLALLGAKAWWMPRRLAAALPAFDIEGENLSREREMAGWPSPDLAVAGAGLSASAVPGAAPLYRDVSFGVRRGTTGVLRGRNETAVSALLLGIAGRARPDEGRLKVCGYALPMRARAVRPLAGYLDLGDAGADPVAAVRAVLAERPQVVVLEGTDRVSDARDRSAIRDLLARDRGARPLTVVAGSTGVADVAEIVPDPVTALDLDDHPIRTVQGDSLVTGSQR